MADEIPTAEELIQIDHRPPKTDWMDVPVNIRKGMYCYASNPKSVEYVGLPNARPWNPLDEDWELPENWQQIIHEGFKERLGKFRSFKVFMDICVRCGACADKCHYFIGTGDPKNMPVLRAELLRSVYRNDFTRMGKILGKVNGARPMTIDVLKEWWYYLFQCSECRRCSVFCPYGIDTAEISMAAREIMDHVGHGQKYCNEILGKVQTIGNNLGLPGPALKATLAEFEEEIEEDTGLPVKMPLDVEGAEVLLITPSADFFAEPHIDGLIGYGKVFHAAGMRWTVSSYASEAANFGMFIGSYENMRRVSSRIREAALELGVKRIVFGECGHAWRVAYSFLNTLAGPFDFLDPNYPVPQHVCEVTHDLIQRGALKFDKSANDDMVLTYHDSCNVARASRMGKKAGGQFTIPRDIIRATCNHFYDMPQDTIGEATFCCGGGGGLLTDDLMELRVKGSVPRAEALKYVVENYGVTHMAAICAICKSQFTKVLPYYGFTLDQIVSVHQLVSNAIVLGAEH